MWSSGTWRNVGSFVDLIEPVQHVKFAASSSTKDSVVVGCLMIFYCCFRCWCPSLEEISPTNSDVFGLSLVRLARQKPWLTGVDYGKYQVPWRPTNQQVLKDMYTLWKTHPKYYIYTLYQIYVNMLSKLVQGLWYVYSVHQSVVGFFDYPDILMKIRSISSCLELLRTLAWLISSRPTFSCFQLTSERP